MSLFAKLRAETHLPGFEGAAGWLNSEPLTPVDGLRAGVRKGDLDSLPKVVQPACSASSRRSSSASSTALAVSAMARS